MSDTLRVVGALFESVPADCKDRVAERRVNHPLEVAAFVHDEASGHDATLHFPARQEFDPFRRAELTLYGAENGDGSGHYIRADVAIFSDGQSVVRNHNAPFDPPLDD